MSTVKIFAFADEAGGSLEEQIAAMTENSLDGLEIRNVDGENVSDISKEKARDIRMRLDNAGLAVWSVGSPIGKISLEGDDFAAHLEKFKHTLDIADILGAKRLRLFSFYLDKSKDPALFKNEVIDRLGQFCELANGSGIALCHENEKGIFGDNAKRCAKIHKALPQMKAVFDPANFIQCGQDTLEAWEILKEYAEYIHVKDALPNGSVVPAGKGAGNVGAIAREFISRGGSAFTIEPHLTVFSGLDKLEREGDKSAIGQYVYESGRVAFDAAYAEFRRVLDDIKA